MCDYSLHNVRNRQAVEGEPLQVHRFPSASLGLASPTELRPSEIQAAGNWWQRLKGWFNTVSPAPATAVCVLPGARLILREIPKALQEKYGVGEEEEVTFVQLNPEVPNYRDAIRFNNGKEVLLQHLIIGQQLDVLCLANSVEVELQQLQAAEPVKATTRARA